MRKFNNMRQIRILSGIILIALGLFSCKNQDWDFPDFDYTTAYFPYQYPVRTLIFGDYAYDNSNDNALKFEISATMGGVYENNEDVIVNFTVDESLVEDLYNNTGGTPILALPQSYYTLSDNSKIIISKGELSGSVTVQLTEAFTADPLAVGTNYVVPLRITSATTDSVLMGSPAVSDPDPRVAGDWVKAPKDFTLFGIKYVNEYDAKYLLRGRDLVKDAANQDFETIVYRNTYVEQDEIVNVTTVSRHVARYSNNVRLSAGSPGKFSMDMTFTEDGNCTIAKTEGSAYDVTGTGKFVEDGDSWGGEQRNVLYLAYHVNDGTYTHQVNDTLVFRNRTVVFEEFSPLIQAD